MYEKGSTIKDPFDFYMPYPETGKEIVRPTILESLEQSFKEVKLMMEDKLPKKTLGEFFEDIKKWNEEESEPKKIHNVILIENTDEVVRASDIIIPDDFKNSPPRFSKLNKYANYYRKHGHFDKPITVIPETNENGKPNKFVLVDGYARYYFATKWFKFKWLPIRYIDIETYCNNEKYVTK